MRFVKKIKKPFSSSPDFALGAAIIIFVGAVFFETASAQVFWSRNFSRSGDFHLKTGSWASSTNRSDEGFLLLQATNNSSASVLVTDTPLPGNLTANRSHVHILVTLRLGENNTATDLRVGLRSPGNFTIRWNLPLSNFSSGVFHTVAIPLSQTADVLDPGFTAGNVDALLLSGGPSSIGNLDLHIERLSLAEIPPVGRLRIVGNASASDPPGGIYYSTIQAAVNASAPRDTVLVKPDTYVESVSLTKDYGMDKTRLIIMASKEGPVILSGNAGINSSANYTGLQHGFNWSATGYPSIRANHVEIVGFIVRDFVSAGFGDRDPGKITIRNCMVHSSGVGGIVMNFPSPDSRVKAYNNLIFLNGWGESWAGGIHLNNKDARLNSITRNATGHSLPGDTDHGHEVIGNVSFLNLDENQYNSDGNGIMLDFQGGSEALVRDNICFFNAGAGIRNLNGRATIRNNIVYKNGWDHRGSATADPTSSRSTNEQVAFVLRYDSAVYNGTLQQFLDLNHKEFVSSRLAENIIWTASQFNFNGPFFTYTTNENQNRSLSQFALEMGTWNLFRGDTAAPETSPPTGHVARQAANGHKLSQPGGNWITDDQYLMVNSNNTSQTLKPQLRQTDLHTFFLPGQHPFKQLPAATHYVPPAYQHIYGQTLLNSSNQVIALSENTTSIGMVWNPNVRKNISSRHAQVANPANRPPLGLSALHFGISPNASAPLAAIAPQIQWDPAYAQTFLNYLNSQFDSASPSTTLPFDWSSQQFLIQNNRRAFSLGANTLQMVQAEDYYQSAVHNDTSLPRWKLVAHDNATFGTPYLHAYTLSSLSQLSQATALRVPFQLGTAGAPLLVLRMQTPGSIPNSNNDSIFVRLLRTTSNTTVSLDLNSVTQNPPPIDPAQPKLTDTSTAGWCRLFVDNAITSVITLAVRLPWLAAGNYEIQLQPRQADVFLDKLGVFTPAGVSQGHQPASGPGPQYVFLDWMKAHLPPALSSQPEYQDPLADPVGLGRTNLLSYAVGLLPDQFSQTALTTPGLATVGSNQHLTLTYHELPGRSDLQYLVEASSDLANWHSGPSVTTETSRITLGNGTQQVTVRDLTPITSPHPRRFLRLRIIHIPFSGPSQKSHKSFAFGFGAWPGCHTQPKSKALALNFLEAVPANCKDMDASMNWAFNAHHSPVGAFASLTLGFPGKKGGLGMELAGPADENLYIGMESTKAGTYQALPFFQAAEDQSQRYDVAASNNLENSAEPLPFPPAKVRRTFGACVDEWAAGDLIMRIFSPVKSVPDPQRATRQALMEALVPAVFIEIVADNSAGKRPRKVFLGYQGGDPYSAMRRLDDVCPFTGVGQGTRTAIASDSKELYSGLGFTPGKCLQPGLRENLSFGLGTTGLLMADVMPGTQLTLRFAVCFFRGGEITSGMPARYFYTKFFRSIEDVAKYALANFDHQKKLAENFELQIAKLPDDRRFQLAHAIRSYYGSTQFLDTNTGPLWVVNEGEYRMMNTFDLTVDHLFFEMDRNPWVVRNQLDWFLKRFSYRDRVRLPDDPKEYPGGLSFTHDMGVANHISKPRHSAYELHGLKGCFSHMTHEQLVNWVLCGVTYVKATQDSKWLQKQLPVFENCLTSLLRRDHPNPKLRDGVMSADSSRCLGGAEITTYDSLDPSLGQARNNLYLAVKTWAAYLGLADILPRGSKPASQASKQAAKCADTVASQIRPDGFIPAVINENNESKIIPAIEGLVFPWVWKLNEALDRRGPYAKFLSALEQHLTTILTPGVCIFPDGGWKLSSTNNNSWLSKIYLCQFVAEQIFHRQPDRRADSAHRRWLLDPRNAYFAWSDQMINGLASGSKYYPRGVTAWLWTKERLAKNLVNP